MGAVWMPDDMNIYLYDLKIVLWIWNDTFQMPLLYLSGTVGKMQCQNSGFDMAVTCFSSFFSFLVLPLSLNQTAAGRSLKEQPWSMKEHISKFVKEINRMLLAQDVPQRSCGLSVCSSSNETTDLCKENISTRKFPSSEEIPFQCRGRQDKNNTRLELPREIS